MSESINKPSVRDVSDYIRSVQFRLKCYELDIIKDTISHYIKTNHPAVTYIQELENRSMVYRLFKLYKRIFDLRLNYRDEYTITFNPTEIEVVQSALQGITHNNITAAVLYGKIHQKTI